MPTVHFKNQNIDIVIEEGITILNAAKRAGVLIESPCNAMGTCGKCKVALPVSQLPLVYQNENNHQVTEEEKAKGIVLSCQTRIYGDIDVTILNKNENKTLKILSEGLSFQYKITNNITKEFNGLETIIYEKGIPIGSEYGNTMHENYGIAIDIGTTTLVAALVHLENGEELATVSALNPQSLIAQDVLSRIQFASTEEGLQKMHQDITNQMNEMIKELANEAEISDKHIYEIIYSGNTAMIHLAVGVNPKSLGKYPYTPVIKGGNSLPASTLGITISPFGKVYLPPIISAYVGPDITSGILSSCLKNKKGTTLFIDIGTNGEMIIAKNGTLIATSTAAGPAFEGMNISCGMRAGNGAIEYFEIDEENRISIKTIADKKAIGICGSGLLDIVGELVKVGVIGKNGKIASKEKTKFPPSLATHIILKEGKSCFAITEDIYLTQKDIRQVQLAKGAIRAGIEALLENQGVKVEEVDRVEIAGSFGYHLREKSLIHLGLLPSEFEGKVQFVGNTSKTGAKAFLLNYEFRDELKEIVKEIEVVELGNKDDFERVFVRCLSF